MALQKDELLILVSMWNFKSYNSPTLLENNFCSPSTSRKPMTPCARFLKGFLKWTCRYGCLGLKEFPPTPSWKFQYVATINPITYLMCNTRFPVQTSACTSFSMYSGRIISSLQLRKQHICVYQTKSICRENTVLKFLGLVSRSQGYGSASDCSTVTPPSASDSTKENTNST